MRGIVGCFAGLCCYSVVAAAQSTATFPATTMTGTHWHIDATGLGPIRIGMPVDQAVQVAGTFTVVPTSRSLEGSRSIIYEVRYNRQLLFIIEPDNATVWRIDVFTPEFRYGEVDDVGVGSTVAQLKQRFPAMRMNGAAGGETCGMVMPQPVGYAFCFKGQPNATAGVTHVRIFSTN